MADEAPADTPMADMSDELESSQPEDVDYDEGEPNSEDAYPSESEEEDELVDEVDETATPTETNRRTRRAPLRVKLMRRSVQSTQTRRASSRVPKRSARARYDDGDENEDEDEVDGVDEEEDELEGEDSGDDTASTSDMPMTARQIARANRARGLATEELLELPMEPSRKKKLSETELALRRSETARRRRNQSEKKLEDDKIETINRLLKKQAGKVRGRHDLDTGDEPKKKARDLRSNEPLPMFRYISNAQGAVLAVPPGPPMIHDEGLYNYTLRTAFGMSREAWSSSARS